jgi:adenylate cyclase
MIIIVLTGFRYSTRLSIAAGILAAVQHLVIYLLLIQAVPANLRQELIDLGPSGIIQKSLYLILISVISAFITSYTRKNIIKIARGTLENQTIKDTFGKYVSREIRDSILESRIDLNGHEKYGAVLFSDIRNFTTLLEKYPSNQVLPQLNEYFSEMVAIIQKHRGIVNKFIGDAIMAVFGLFEEGGRPEENAVRAGIEMQKRLEELNRIWHHKKKHLFHMGIGINSGKFSVGNIGSKDRMEFSCIGDTVNTASRLEALTKQYLKPVIISEHIYVNLVPDTKNRTSLIETIQLKGKTTPLKIYEVRISEAEKR